MANSDGDEDVKGKARESGHHWIMDSGCSRHMTRKIENFPSLKAYEESSVFFGDGNKGYIVDDVNFIDGLKFSLLVMYNKRTQCVKENFHVIFDEAGNIRKGSTPNDDYDKLGNPLNTLKKPHKGNDDIVYQGLKLETKDKDTRDQQNEVIPLDSNPLSSKENDQSPKAIRQDHDTKFDNAKFNQFCTELGISHNFSALRTPQQNGVVERKDRNLMDTEMTMLIDSGLAHNFLAEAINTICYMTSSSVKSLSESFKLLMPGVVKRKEGYNPATWMLEVIAPAQEIMLGVDFTNLYKNSDLSKSQDLFNVIGSMYVDVLFLGIQNASLVQPVVDIKRKVLYRERAARMYSAIPYAFGQFLIHHEYEEFADHRKLKCLFCYKVAFMGLLNFMYSNTLTTNTASALLDVLMVVDKFEVASCMRFYEEVMKLSLTGIEAILSSDDLQEKGLVSFVVYYEFVVRTKPTEEYISKYKGNYTFTGGKAVGYRNLFAIVTLDYL
ncbi:hypothetical protein FXO37_14433 [Capsicum annuum]|nr:hypothetical protein FXO37_14433 [Capsicum annuum]